MARPKGSKKVGGRKKGTPNKVTSDLRQWVDEVLNNGKEKFQEYLATLPPEEYIKCFSGLLNYAIPKKQAMSLEAQMEVEYKHLAELMETAPEEYMDKIADRILKLQNEKGGNE